MAVFLIHFNKKIQNLYGFEWSKKPSLQPEGEANQ